MSQTELYRELPSVDELLHEPAIAALVAQDGHALVGDACRSVLENLRREIAAGHLDSAKLALALSEMPWAIGNELRRALRHSLRPVINATGVVLHTNLGRAPLAEAAISAMAAVARGYSNLEYDVEAGRRGSRYAHCAALLRELTGAEDALVVNNCAAALVLALNTLANGREAIISRGELVEIGGSFRIPEIMERSGARHVEVGTTNRTHAEDYRRALGSDGPIGALLKV